LLAAGSQALLVAYVIWRYSVDVPFLDQWSLVEDMAKLHAGEWGLTDLWRSHNGHRIVVPRLVLVPLALLSGWDTRLELVLNAVAATASFLLLAFLAKGVLGTRDLGRYALAVAALGGVVYSLAQWENWLWGIQLCVFMVVSFGLASLAALTVPGRGFLVLALALAALASLSQAPGLMVWPAGVVGLAWRRRASGQGDWKAMLAWCAAGLALFVAYFTTAPGDSSNPGELGFVLRQPVRVLVFALTVVGAPVTSFTGSAWPPNASTVSPIAGALGIAATALVTWHSLASRRSTGDSTAGFALAACTFGLLAAALVALGRSSMGAPAAMASRYVTLMTPFWAGHLVLAIAWAWPSGGERGSPLLRGWIALVLCGLTISSLSSLDTFPGRQATLLPTRAALAADGPTELLRRLHPATDYVRAWSTVLRRLRLSVFRAASAAVKPGGSPAANGARHVGHVRHRVSSSAPLAPVAASPSVEA
jgi:hypothetical protein